MRRRRAACAGMRAASRCTLGLTTGNQPASYQLSGPSPRRSLLLTPMSTARRRRRGDRPPLLGEDGLHADPTRNGLTAPEEIGAARSLVHAYRTHGHMAARLDPLGSDPIGDPALDPAYHGLARRRARSHPGRRPRPLRPRRDARRRAAAPARDLRRADRVPDRAPLGPPPAALAARGDRVGRVHAAPPARRAPPHPRPAAARRDVRALPPPRVPRREAVLDRGTRRDGADARRDDHARRPGRHRGGRRRHGAPRPAERARARAAPQLLVDHVRVRGPPRRRHPRGAAGRRRGRRQVPPRRALVARHRRRRARGRRGARRAAAHRHLAAAEPLAPRVREPGRQRPRARAADRPGAQRRALRHEPRDRDLDPRRRGLPRPGRRGRDAQPAVALGLPRRRHAARDREQPGRLHDGRPRLALDALLVGSRQGLRHPDHPRQRGRRRRLPQRGAPRDGLPRALRARRADRPRRATAASATTRPTSPPTRSRCRSSASRRTPRSSRSTRSA